MAQYVIGITGKKRSGKDTAAARLISEHGFTQVRFVDPLRTFLKAQNPVVDVYVFDAGDSEVIRLTDVLGPDDDWETAKELPEVRRLMQATGTDAARGIFGQDFWVKQAQRRIEEIPGPVVVTDVRFPNEAHMIELFGDVARVTRPGLVSTDAHASETAMNDYWVEPPFGLVNDGTIADLHDKVDALVRHPDVLWKFRIP